MLIDYFENITEPEYDLVNKFFINLLLQNNIHRYNYINCIPL